MPTYDVAPSTGVALRGSTRVSVLKNVIDFDALYKTTDAFGVVTWNKPIAADIVKTHKVKAGSIVLAYGAKCLTAPAGTALTVTFGATTGTIAGTFTQTAALGSVNAATVTAGVLSAATDLTATLTTITTCTALGKWEFYAVVADLN